MKRFLTILLTILSVFVLFSSCTDGSPQDAEANSSPTVTVTATAAASPAAQQTDENTPSPEPSQTNNTSVPKDEKEYVFEFNTARNTTFAQQIFETDDSIYCIERLSAHSYEELIYFSDKEYQDWMPLCSKPNCIHNSEDCNAMPEGYAANRMWIYGRHIYYAVSDTSSDGLGRNIELWRMKLDGSDHERLFNYSIHDSDKYKEACKITPPTLSYGWYFHDKYFIIKNDFIFIGEGGTTLHTTMHEELAYDLDDLDKEPVDLSFINDDGAYDTGGYVLAGQGEYLYRVEDDKQTLIRQSLETGERKVICELPISVMLRGGMLEGDTLYVLNDWSYLNLHRQIFAVDVNTGEYSMIFDGENEPMFLIGAGYVFGLIREDDAELERGFYIYNLNGELKSFIPYEETGMDIYTYYVSENYVLGYEYERYLQGSSFWRTPEYYLNMTDIENGTPHWKKWGE